MLYSLIEDQTLKTENIFTILALLNQLTVCLSVFPVTLPIMIKAILSIRRLKSLFSRPDVQVHEGKNEEKTDNSTQSAISMINATYFWPNSDIKGIDNITTDITKGIHQVYASYTILRQVRHLWISKQKINICRYNRYTKLKNLIFQQEILLK